MAIHRAELVTTDVERLVPQLDDATPKRTSSQLRIGLVCQGRLQQEHIIAPPAAVRIGTTPGCWLDPSEADLPDGFALFDCIDGQYRLNPSASMSGHVVLAPVTYELPKLATQGNRADSGLRPLCLKVGAHGRVFCGDVEILFRVEPHSAIRSRFDLTTTLRRGISKETQSISTIAAISFFLHFIAVGAFFSDWQDPIVDEEAQLAQLVDLVRDLPPAPPVEDVSESQPRGRAARLLSTNELRELERLQYASAPYDDRLGDARLRSIFAEPVKPASRLPRIAPKGIATIDTPKVEGGTVANVARVVAGMRAGFRNCYSRALAGNPDAAGLVRLKLHIDRHGEVSDVEAHFIHGKLVSTVDCIKLRARGAQFDPPDGRQATVQFSVKFERP